MLNKIISSGLDFGPGNEVANRISERIIEKSESSILTSFSLLTVGSIMLVVSSLLISFLISRLIFRNWRKFGAGVRLLFLHFSLFFFLISLTRTLSIFGMIIFNSLSESVFCVVSGITGVTLVHHLYLFSNNTVEFKKLITSMTENFTDSILVKTRVGLWKWTFSTETEKERLEWDEVMFEIFGVDPESFDHTYKSFSQLVHPEDLDEINEAVDKSIKDGSVFNCQMRVTDHAGGWRLMHGRGVVVNSLDGKPIYMAGFNFPH